MRENFDKVKGWMVDHKKQIIAVCVLMFVVFLSAGIVLYNGNGSAETVKADSGNIAQDKDGNGKTSVKDIKEQETSGDAQAEAVDTAKKEETEKVAEDKAKETEKKGDTEKKAKDAENKQTTAASASAHQHSWVAEKTTVNHPAEGRWEERVVQAAWDEPIYETKWLTICYSCGADITYNLEHTAWCGSGSYYNEPRQVQTGTKHHDAVTQSVWVETKAAWSESVPTGRSICSGCGAVQ